MPGNRAHQPGGGGHRTGRAGEEKSAGRAIMDPACLGIERRPPQRLGILEALLGQQRRPGFRSDLQEAPRLLPVDIVPGRVVARRCCPREDVQRQVGDDRLVNQAAQRIGKGQPFAHGMRAGLRRRFAAGKPGQRPVPGRDQRQEQEASAHPVERHDRAGLLRIIGAVERFLQRIPWLPERPDPGQQDRPRRRRGQQPVTQGRPHAPRRHEDRQVGKLIRLAAIAARQEASVEQGFDEAGHEIGARLDGEDLRDRARHPPTGRRGRGRARPRRGPPASRHA